MVRTYVLPQLVEFFWWDHYSIGDDWYDRGHKHEPCILSAVGYLVDENEHYYWVASTYEVANGSYSSGTAVLKNCVTHMNILKEETTVHWDGGGVHKTESKQRRPRMR